jgi:hypothetical protein
VAKRKGRPRAARSKLKLHIDLVPLPLWEDNLRNFLGKHYWGRILRTRFIDCYGTRCTACGTVATERKLINLHEQWAYDTTVKPAKATLTSLELRCRQCHAVEHFGRTINLAAQGYPDAVTDAIAHFCRVNRVAKAVFDEHETEAFAEWRERSALRWEADIGTFWEDWMEDTELRRIWRDDEYERDWGPDILPEHDLQ